MKWFLHQSTCISSSANHFICPSFDGFLLQIAYFTSFHIFRSELRRPLQNNSVLFLDSLGFLSKTPWARCCEEAATLPSLLRVSLCAPCSLYVSLRILEEALESICIWQILIFLFYDLISSVVFKWLKWKQLNYWHWWPWGSSNLFGCCSWLFGLQSCHTHHDAKQTTFTL